MKKQVWTGVIAATACTFAIGLSAQSTTPPSQASRPQSPSASDHITVTGCLQRDSASATAGATGTSGSTTASASSSGFVLNVTPSPSSPSAAGAATSGTSGSASSYKLDADEKLTAHVGHKVEITGTLDKSMSSSTAPSGSTSASASTAPKLKVDSVKMIAATCS